MVYDASLVGLLELSLALLIATIAGGNTVDGRPPRDTWVAGGVLIGGLFGLAALMAGLAELFA